MKRKKKKRPQEEPRRCPSCQEAIPARGVTVRYSDGARASFGLAGVLAVLGSAGAAALAGLIAGPLGADAPNPKFLAALVGAGAVPALAVALLGPKGWGRIATCSKCEWSGPVSEAEAGGTDSDSGATSSGVRRRSMRDRSARGAPVIHLLSAGILLTAVGAPLIVFGPPVGAHGILSGAYAIVAAMGVALVAVALLTAFGKGRAKLLAVAAAGAVLGVSVLAGPWLTRDTAERLEDLAWERADEEGTPEAWDRYGEVVEEKVRRDGWREAYGAAAIHRADGDAERLRDVWSELNQRVEKDEDWSEAVDGAVEARIAQLDEALEAAGSDKEKVQALVNIVRHEDLPRAPSKAFTARAYEKLEGGQSLVVRLIGEGMFEVDGKRYSDDPGQPTGASFKDLVRVRASPVPGPTFGGVKTSGLWVHARCRPDTEFRDVHALMMACLKQAVFRIRLGLDDDSKLLKTYLPTDPGPSAQIDLKEARLELVYRCKQCDQKVRPRSQGPSSCGRCGEWPASENRRRGWIQLRIGSLILNEKGYWAGLSADERRSSPKWKLLADKLDDLKKAYDGPNSKGLPVRISIAQQVPCDLAVTLVKQVVETGLENFAFEAPQRDFSDW